MKLFQFTRKEMAQLLLALKGEDERRPLAILQNVWANSQQQGLQQEVSASAVVTLSLPSILEKIIKIENVKGREIGFSLNEIVSLGNQIKWTSFSAGAVQNWVKRDIKTWIGTPQLGKKYTLEQAALLFIVEDLRRTLDFETIRQLFSLIFKNPDDYLDDLINPISLFAAYSSIFEELFAQNQQCHNIEVLIQTSAQQFVETITDLNYSQKEAISKTIVIAILSVQTAYFQSLAKRYVNTTLFLQNL